MLRSGEQVGPGSCLCWKRSRATGTSLLWLVTLYGGDGVKGVNQSSPFDISGLLRKLFRGEKGGNDHYSLMKGGL